MSAFTLGGKRMDKITESIKNGTLSKETFILQVESLLENMFMKQNLKSRSEVYTNIMTAARNFNVEQEVEELANKKAIELNEPEPWELPESFDSLKKPAPFPLNSLPLLLRDYLKAVADYVQVVPEMAVLPLLSVLSLCVQ